MIFHPLYSHINKNLIISYNYLRFLCLYIYILATDCLKLIISIPLTSPKSCAQYTKSTVLVKTCLKFSDKERVSIGMTAPKKGDACTGRGKLWTSHRTENAEMFAYIEIIERLMATRMTADRWRWR